MSGGEQQMLAIGRAMMADPQLIMFDEPSLGLAPKVVDHVLLTPSPPSCIKWLLNHFVLGGCFLCPSRSCSITVTWK